MTAPAWVIARIKWELEEAKQELRSAEQGYFLSMEPWANSSGMAEIEAIEDSEAKIRWLERELKVATGEIEDDCPF